VDIRQGFPTFSGKKPQTLLLPSSPVAFVQNTGRWHTAQNKVGGILDRTQVGCILDITQIGWYTAQNTDRWHTAQNTCRWHTAQKTGRWHIVQNTGRWYTQPPKFWCIR